MASFEYDVSVIGPGFGGMTMGGRGQAGVGGQHIRAQLGRRPALAAGNSRGNRQMLEWAAYGHGPSLALLVNHDNERREFRYLSPAETLAEPEPISDVGARQGWTVVSRANAWETVLGRRRTRREHPW